MKCWGLFVCPQDLLNNFVDGTLALDLMDDDHVGAYSCDPMFSSPQVATSLYESSPSLQEALTPDSMDIVSWSTPKANLHVAAEPLRVASIPISLVFPKRRHPTACTPSLIVAPKTSSYVLTKRTVSATNKPHVIVTAQLLTKTKPFSRVATNPPLTPRSLSHTPTSTPSTTTSAVIVVHVWVCTLLCL